MRGGWWGAGGVVGGCGFGGRADGLGWWWLGAVWRRHFERCVGIGGVRRWMSVAVVVVVVAARRRTVGDYPGLGIAWYGFVSRIGSKE